MYFYLCIVDESMFLDSEEGYWLYKEEGIRYKNSKKALKNVIPVIFSAYIAISTRSYYR